MPTSSGSAEAHRPAAAAPTGLPPVLKSEKASEVILKYMEGVLKRSQKMGDSWLYIIYIISYITQSRACTWALGNAAGEAMFRCAWVQVCSWQARQYMTYDIS